jgi:myo-inositol-1(or 4)-monophosphatase
MDLTEYRPFLVELTEHSAEVIRPYFGKADIAVESKSDESPVTLADRGAEARLREVIHARYPSHGFIGEEYGSEREDAEFVWVLDPIDGTISFVTGCPLFGTLICLLHQGRPVLGAIHQPITGQLCVGDGERTTLNDRVVRVRKQTSISQATLLTTDFGNVDKFRPKSGFASLAREARVVRTWGDCYGYLLLASGFADVMMDPIMKPWDLMSLIPIVRGAGGVITDWYGQDPVRGDSIVAASPGLHAEIIARLAQPS